MELKSIYRTYRPQTWDDLVGQERIVQTFKNAITHALLSHAYLFTGPRGVGKTTTARLLAKVLNCEKRKDGTANPCNACRSCEEIRVGRSLDVLEIDAASHTGVDNVRENIIAASRVASFDQKKKVFIIDEVHMLSLSAFNALLKTLEEPPQHVFFILATTEVDRIPETIISRCQRFDFRRIHEKDIVTRLSAIAKKEGVRVALEVLHELARHAEGGMRDAESMFGQLVALGKKQITVDEARLLLPHGDRVRAEKFLIALLEHHAHDALLVLQDFLETGGDVEVFVKDCITLVRTSLLRVLHGERKTEDALGNDSAAFISLLRSLMRAAAEVSITEPPELPLELVIAEYANGAERVASPDADRVAPESTTAKNRKNTDNPSSAEKKPESPARTQEREESQKSEADAPAPSLAHIQEKWNDILQASKKYNHSLALILKVATPLAVDARTVVLGFRHSFHVERLAKPDHQNITAKIFTEVFGAPLVILGKVVAEEKREGDEKKNSDPLLRSILETFGGEVVQA